MSDINILEKIKQAEVDSEAEVKNAEEEAGVKMGEARAKAEEDLKAGTERANIAYQKEISDAKADASKRAQESYESKASEIKALKKPREEDVMKIFSDVIKEEFGV